VIVTKPPLTGCYDLYNLSKEITGNHIGCLLIEQYEHIVASVSFIVPQYQSSLIYLELFLYTDRLNSNTLNGNH
jgi:hypothetical protein